MSVTWIFVPGDRPERFAKAAAAGADEVIIDLEDAVAAGHKESARRSVVAWLETGQAWVRINAVGTPWHDADIAALVGSPGLRGIMVAKAEDPQHLSEIGAVRLVALIESALGVHRAHDIAAVPAVERLAFGSIDFALDIDAVEDDRALLHARSILVSASRVAGLAGPIDGVTVSTTDVAEIAAAAQRARELGFGGKLCIHPAQLAAAAGAFRPSQGEIDWADEILAAVAADSGAVRLGEQMIDRPVILRAERIRQRAAANGRKSDE